MNSLEKLNFLKEERYLDLNKWERNFIDDLYHNCDGLDPAELHQHEIESEYLSVGQINKVDEIYKELVS